MNDNLNTNVPNEAESPAFLVGAVIGSAKQKQCTKCGRCYFREEF
jgi:hypothetical protein